MNDQEPMLRDRLRYVWQLLINRAPSSPLPWRRRWKYLKGVFR